MLIYNITLKCDIGGCTASHNVTSTVVRPAEWDIPRVSNWDGPFKGWTTVEGMPTTCPQHTRLAAEGEGR